LDGACFACYTDGKHLVAEKALNHRDESTKSFKNLDKAFPAAVCVGKK
jgi:hypothetical protein